MTPYPTVDMAILKSDEDNKKPPKGFEKFFKGKKGQAAKKEED